MLGSHPHSLLTSASFMPCIPGVEPNRREGGAVFGHGTGPQDSDRLHPEVVLERSSVRPLICQMKAPSLPVLWGYPEFLPCVLLRFCLGRGPLETTKYAVLKCSLSALGREREYGTSWVVSAFVSVSAAPVIALIRIVTAYV
jgi:hypothetical protein